MAYAARVLELLDKLSNYEKIDVLTTAGHQVQLALARETRERQAPPLPSLPPLNLPDLPEDEE